MVRIFLVVLALGALLANPAAAHRLSLFAAAIGAEIEGKAYFAGGSAARNIMVHVTDADGTLLGELKTDEAGTFTFTATRRTDHFLAADSGDGHVAKFVIGADELPHSLPGGLENTAQTTPPPDRQQVNPPSGSPGAENLDERIEKALARQLHPLREQLAAFEDEIRLRDVIGGIGYIVGFAGLLAWFGARRKNGGK